VVVFYKTRHSALVGGIFQKNILQGSMTHLGVVGRFMTVLWQIFSEGYR